MKPITGIRKGLPVTCQRRHGALQAFGQPNLDVAAFHEEDVLRLRDASGARQWRCQMGLYS